MTDSLGSIEPGKLADLVLLDANPLDDIRNTQKIRAVVADGRLYRRAHLDQLLAGKIKIATTRSAIGERRIRHPSGSNSGVERNRSRSVCSGRPYMDPTPLC